MKTHTVHGAATLKAALAEYPGTTFLEMARDIALGHHERYDGRGYPQSLAGDGIPLSAHVMALANVYDALTSRRVYKEAYSHNRTKSMIVEEAGKHFDPAMVEAFLVHEQQFIAIRGQYRNRGQHVGKEEAENSRGNSCVIRSDFLRRCLEPLVPLFGEPLCYQVPHAGSVVGYEDRRRCPPAHAIIFAASRHDVSSSSTSRTVRSSVSAAKGFSTRRSPS